MNSEYYTGLELTKYVLARLLYDKAGLIDTGTILDAAYELLDTFWPDDAGERYEKLVDEMYQTPLSMLDARLGTHIRDILLDADGNSEAVVLAYAIVVCTFAGDNFLLVPYGKVLSAMREDMPAATEHAIQFVHLYLTGNVEQLEMYGDKEVEIWVKS